MVTGIMRSKRPTSRYQEGVTMPNSEPYIIFTDGACLGNPGPGGYGWTMLTPSETIYESGGAQENTTNNRMEMMAVLKVLEFIPSDAYAAKIHSDSSYVLKGIQEWRHGWKARDWRTAAGDEVANLDIWLDIDAVVTPLERNPKVKLEWIYVPGHQGVPGNERADAIASAYAAGEDPRLYQGPVREYAYDLKKPFNPKKQKSKGGSSSKKKPFGYASFVDGIFSVHKTWPECESRVKGKSGAKFKKVYSQAEADDLKQIWR